MPANSRRRDEVPGTAGFTITERWSSGREGLSVGKLQGALLTGIAVAGSGSGGAPIRLVLAASEGGGGNCPGGSASQAIPPRSTGRQNSGAPAAGGSTAQVCPRLNHTNSVAPMAFMPLWP